MSAQNIFLKLSNPTLERLIDEQLTLFKDLKRDPSSAPDLVIIQQGQATDTTFGAAQIFEIPKGAIRLGEVMDKLGYLLSGREFHIEDENENIDLGEFLLIPAENLLIHQGTKNEIRLTDKERLLLRFLYEAGDDGIARKQLLKDVWGYADDAETHTLETHIYRLRQKIEQHTTHEVIKVIDGIYTIDVKSMA